MTETNFNRTLAADRQVEAVQAAYEAETVTLDQLLEAQRRRADAQTSYFRTLLDYQRAIIMVHYRKGTILDYDNVYLQEGPWPDKAKFDAHRLARQRDASLYINYGFTRPSVMSTGSVRQDPQRDGMLTNGMGPIGRRRAARNRIAGGSADPGGRRGRAGQRRREPQADHEHATGFPVGTAGTEA